MKIPTLVETALRVLWVLRRARVYWVPGPTITQYVKDPVHSINTVLTKMTKAGLLEGKRGFGGGFRIAKPIMLGHLFMLFAPGSLPKKGDPLSCNIIVQGIQRGIRTYLRRVVVWPVNIDEPLTEDEIEERERQAKGVKRARYKKKVHRVYAFGDLIDDTYIVRPGRRRRNRHRRERKRRDPGYQRAPRRRHLEGGTVRENPTGDSGQEG